MKKIIYTTIFLALIGVTFIACNKGKLIDKQNTEINQINSINKNFVNNQQTAQSMLKARESVTITCAGKCDCIMIGTLQSVSCSCNECVMSLTFRSVSGKITNTVNLKDAKIEVPTLEYFLDYSLENLTDYKITEITVYNNNGETTTLFTYKVNGVESSIMYSTRANGDTYQIECNGSCGCREVYSFNSNSASCSCNDCVMLVTKVSK